MDLTQYDLILLNTSGGKDSSVMAWNVTKMAEAQGVRDRLVLGHATFREEWDGTIEIVKLQAEQLGLPYHVVTRGEGLLDYVRRRKMWPSSKARYCTSDFKRAPIDKLITKLAPGLDRRVRVLNVMGLRAEESPSR
jgi:3'-phosphoadenosine 5'-phosphosulfate sulfotransferase (PAPS reductase)/FAD synthetase